MDRPLEKFYRFLDEPIFGRARVVLALLVMPLALSYAFPLWRIRMVAPQYPEGLEMAIYAYKLEGGHEGQDIQEINTLNHYIGMKKIDRTALSDLDWLPFLFGLLGILALRVAAIGNVRSLVDLLVLTGYMSLFGLGRFYYKLYTFGHDLDPAAPFKVEPFTPVIFGEKQIANFTTEAYPGPGSVYIAIFATGIAALLLWHLVAGRRRAARAARAGTG